MTCPARLVRPRFQEHTRSTIRRTDTGAHPFSIPSPRDRAKMQKAGVATQHNFASLQTPAFENYIEELTQRVKRNCAAFQPSLTSLQSQAVLQKVKNSRLPLLLQAFAVCTFATVRLNANRIISWKQAESNAERPILQGPRRVKPLTQKTVQHPWVARRCTACTAEGPHYHRPEAFPRFFTMA